MENKNLYKSLAHFTMEVPTIHKGTKGYGYTYADLAQIFDVIKPLLEKHGLGFTQMIDGNSLKTTIFHVETGENISSSADIPSGGQLKGMNEFQTLGSAITYLRRYSLSAMLGLVTDVDNDAGGEQTKPTKKYISNAQLQKLADKIEAGELTVDEAILKCEDNNLNLKEEHKRALQAAQDLSSINNVKQD